MARAESVHYSILLLFLCFIAGLSVCGCSSPRSHSLESNISGKWQEIGNTEIIELFSNNRFSITNEGQSYLGTWNILDDGRIRFAITARGSTHIYTGKVEGDTLSVTMQDGSVVKYRKM